MQAGSRQNGFTYVALLFALTVFALGAASLGEVTSRSVQRDRERELIEIGLRIQDAIGSYYMASPGSTKEFPTSFADLEFDARYAGVKRHLRRLERDPLTAQFDWGFIRGADGGIAGVFSTSGKTPLALPGAEIHGYLIPPGGRYPDWKFSFVPPKTP